MEALPGGLFGFESRVLMRAVAERLILGLSATAEIDGLKLTLLILFALVIQHLCSTRQFIRTILQRFYGDSGHSSSPLRDAVRSNPALNMSYAVIGFNNKNDESLKSF